MPLTSTSGLRVSPAADASALTKLTAFHRKSRKGPSEAPVLRSGKGQDRRLRRWVRPIGEGTKVTQLLGVADGPHRLHQIVGDVHGDDGDGHPLAIEEQSPRLTVDHHSAHTDHPQAPPPICRAEEHPRHAIPSVDRTGERRALAPPICVPHTPRGEKSGGALRVPFHTPSKEAPGDPPPPLP